MMRRALPGAPRSQVCQICKAVSGVQARSFTRSFSNAGSSNSRSKDLQPLPPSFRTLHQLGRTIATTQRRHAQQRLSSSLYDNSITRFDNHITNCSQRRAHATDAGSLAALVDRVTAAFLAQQGIPSEKTTYDALRAVGQIDIDAVEEPEQLADVRGDAESETRQITHVLDLGGGKKQKKARTPAATDLPPSFGKTELVKKVSDAAYSIVTHPNVILTPRLLDQYVRIQARLGTPQTLTEIFSLYRVKPLPKEVGGTIQFESRDPKRVQAAVPGAIADRALDVAIAAKDVDSAIGIVANTYAAEPFLRSKLVNKAVLPAMALSLVPAVAYALASSLSLLQDTMDRSSATGIAFAAILAYAAFTGTIGVVVVTTANDQMKRVTWLPGLPLRQRWLREEERAALDKVACAFGFEEQHRWGEENGPEFNALRNYIFSRGMVLDAVELMEGMD